MKDNRFILTLSMYIYAETKEEAIESSNNIIKILDNTDSRCEIESLVQYPFGTIGEPDISKNVLKDKDNTKS